MDNQTNTTAQDSLHDTVPQENILTNIVDTEEYEKPLRNARGWLYAVAGFQLAMGFYEYFTTDNHLVGAVALGIDAFIALVFLVLALWSRKKPVPAFLSALVCYITFSVGFMLLDSSNIFKGLLIKILVVIALVKAYNSAKEYVAIKDSLGEDL